ncbi:quinolinate synthetase [Stella humosa]|uniref:Quinolinate synthase n=1 Tax=Stella humosa TaxID=94 RepID=A0A3N1L5M8_9PROT|nr:quinolinate synthase NadA [Stella humosa]ROP84705.1 quinolinate synthetase [Stella humosa]BBK34225.1 quinolinate synthase A [Stella humosa]
MDLVAERVSDAGRLAAARRRLDGIIPDAEWHEVESDIDAILRLKRERDAVILAHNYQTPDIYHGIADIVGDSLALAREAARTQASVIVLCGVHFMAETAKILNPGKTVLIPDPAAGCSLADSITAADVRLMRQRHPGVPVAVYVNTSAEVKAEADICCTSGNAEKIVDSLPGDSVIFLPDEYLASWVAGRTAKRIIAWHGHCEVHERFTAEDIARVRREYGKLDVIAHPECPPDVLAAADFVGSTAQMTDWVKSKRPPRVLLLTECSMSDNVAAEVPDVELVRACNLCPHMKRIDLAKVRASLETMTHAVEIAPDVAARARRSVERMLEVR